MRRAAAVLAAAAAVALPAAQAAPKKGSPVLGFDVTRTGVTRLAWFDPETLTTLRGRKARLGRFTESWSFSPGRSSLAVATAQSDGYGRGPLFKLRFVNARSMRVLGEVGLGAWQFDAVTWLRGDRLLAVTHGDGGDAIAVVDPSRRRVVRSVPLPRVVFDAQRVPGGLALLLGGEASFGAATLAVVDADGAVRTATLDRISIGRTVDAQGKMEARSPGLAVDAAGGRAFVVGSDFTIAEVDLETLRLAYHGGSVRSLTKELHGPQRYAVWLGDGMLAVAGSDYAGDETRGMPVGLRLVDTRTWRTRLVDANAGFLSREAGSPIFLASGGMTSTHFGVYGMDGTLRYRLDLDDGQWLSAQGPYGYVCGAKDRVLRVLDARAGTQAVGLVGTRACPTLLYAQSG